MENTRVFDVCQGMGYVLGRLMGSQEHEVEKALHEAVLAAVYRDYQIPSWLMEAVDRDAIVTPAWVIAQLEEESPKLFEHAAQYAPDQPDASAASST